MLNSRKAWIVTSVLFLGQVINYVDKSVIGLAAVPIMRDLHLSPMQYGLVASSFFSLYAIAGVTVGLSLTHRVSSKTLISVMVVIWSLAQLPAVLGGTLGALIASRVLLGVGEGPFSPACVSAAHAWFTPDRRNMPTAVVMVGSSVGSLVAGPLLSYVIIGSGWRAAFLLCGALGLVWLALWRLLGEDGPVATSTQPVDASRATALSQWAVWRDPTILALLAVGFAAYWTTAFGVAWLAPLVRQLGYGAAATGWIVAAAAALNIAILMGVSLGSQRAMRRGASSRAARGLVNAACLLAGAAAFAVAAVVADPLVKLALTATGCALPTLSFALGPPMVSEVAPAAWRGRFMITIYAAVTVGGFVAPIVAGQLIGRAGIAGFDRALLVNALVVAAGGLVGLVLLRPERSALRLARLARLAVGPAA